MSEADTCRRFVTPRLYEAGWNDDQIFEQMTLTDGRIIVIGEKVRRGKQKRADYILCARTGRFSIMSSQNCTDKLNSS